MDLADSDSLPRVESYSGAGSSAFVVRVRDYHPLWLNFPVHSTKLAFSHSSKALGGLPILTYYPVATAPQGCNVNDGLGSSPFARHYLGNHCCFLLLRVLRCFSSPGIPSQDYLFILECMALHHTGFPIRKSPVQRMLTPYRGFSQLATSFFGSLRQGIHRVPLLA